MLLNVAAGDQYQCAWCDSKRGKAFDSLLLPDRFAPGAELNPDSKLWTSEVHVKWASHWEVVPLTSDNGGPEPPEFHQKLAGEAIRGWKYFREKVLPSLPANNNIKEQTMEGHAGAINDGFFHWQKGLFEFGGDMKAATLDRPPQGKPGNGTSWPEMDALPEYQKLRKYVDRLTRRYLIRSGLHPEQARGLNYSIFNWAAVHRPGEFHGPHTHVGEYVVAVFYAQAGPRAGKLRFGDPRGHSAPFGQNHFYTPRAGELVIFPSWLSHMATVTSFADDEVNPEEPYRMTFSFNIGPDFGPIPCNKWFTDPTGEMSFMRHEQIDRVALKF